MPLSETQKIQAIRRMPFTVRAVDSMEQALERLDSKISRASSRGMRFEQGTLTPWPQLRADVGRIRQALISVTADLEQAYRRAADAGRVERRPDLGLGIEPVTFTILAVLAAVAAIIAVYWWELSAQRQAQAEREMLVTQAQIRAFETSVDRQIELFDRRNPTPAPTPPGSPAPSPPPIVPVPPIQLPRFPRVDPEPRAPSPGEQIQQATGGLAVLAVALGALFLLPRLIKRS